MALPDENQYIISTLFKAGSVRDHNMIDTLLKIKGISLNMVNEQGKTFIATWCEAEKEFCFFSERIRDLKKIEFWLTSGQIDLSFKSQGVDILKWCIKIITRFGSTSSEDLHLDFARKVILFLPTNRELSQSYSILLPETVKSSYTLSLTDALLSLPDIDIHQKGDDNKDAFQIALENKNIKAINILSKALNLSKDTHSQLKLSTKPNFTLEALKLMILEAYALLFNNKTNEFNELLVKLNICALHLFEESAAYPNNFPELLFELSNNLSTIKNGEFDNTAYALKKVAAELGYNRAQNIINNFSEQKKPEHIKKLTLQPNYQDEAKSIIKPASQGKSIHRFFQHFVSKSKGKVLGDSQTTIKQVLNTMNK
ncbi:hypothetical protein ACNVED_09085 [Legionella sp. D16C41]|uniref:hypothetical protein n=1 Tax=Legionella sp. D16C41 TaxID=3402688 RepID=UPI003AF585BC